MDNVTLREELMQAMFKFKNMRMILHPEQDSNMSDFIALKVIARNEKMKTNNLYFSDIQRFLRISKPAVSQLINSLEKKEMITREIDKKDRRKFIVKLTKKGYNEMKRMHEESDKLFMEIIQRFGEDETQELIRLLNKLSDIAQDVKNDKLCKE